MIVYLAGGMKTEWRDSIIAAFPDWTFLDPSRHGLDDEREYTAWDLDGVRKSDIVFGYMEITNPSGIGLSVEFGYGHALRKRLIFVEPTDLPIVERQRKLLVLADVLADADETQAFIAALEAYWDARRELQEGVE